MSLTVHTVHFTFTWLLKFRKQNWSVSWALKTFSSLTDSFGGCDWSGSVDIDSETWACCSSSHPCGLFEGDCDEDNGCIGHFLCGTNNCLNTFDSEADCCYDPTKSENLYFRPGTVIRIVNNSPKSQILSEHISWASIYLSLVIEVHFCVKNTYFFIFFKLASFGVFYLMNYKKKLAFSDQILPVPTESAPKIVVLHIRKTLPNKIHEYCSKNTLTLSWTQ